MLPIRLAISRAVTCAIVRGTAASCLGSAILLALVGCTVISGPCSREVTVKTECEPTGTATVILPGTH